MLALVEKAMAKDWNAKAQEIAAKIAEHAAKHDADDSFVAEGFAALEEAGFFTALVISRLTTVEPLANALRAVSL